MCFRSDTPDASGGILFSGLSEKSMQKRDAGDANSAYAPDSLTFRLFTWPVSLPQPIEAAKQKRAKPESPAWIQSKYFSILQAKIFASADFLDGRNSADRPKGVPYGTRYR